MIPLAKVTNGELDWQYDGETVWLARIEELEGKWVQIPLPKPVRKPKSQRQLGYYHAVCLPLVHRAMLELGWDVDGVPVCIEMCDQYLKWKCGRHLYDETKERFKKRNASLDECREFISNVIKFALVKFGVTIPEPKKE